MKKKYFGYALLVFILLGAIIFVACGKVEAKANGFTFSYEKNSAQKVEDDEHNYIKVKLAIKNTKDEKNTLVANKFKLYQGEKEVFAEVYFGNNIVDKMDSEEFEAGASMDMIINLLLDEEVAGKLVLWYDETNLFEFNV